MPHSCHFIVKRLFANVALYPAQVRERETGRKLLDAAIPALQELEEQPQASRCSALPA
jgi:hypothetical protein